MKALILGDVHCDWIALNITVARALKECPDITHIIQVGDFGYAWPQQKPFKFSKAYIDDPELELLKDISCHWLDGNHENFNVLDADGGDSQPGWIYQPRGSVLEIEEYRLLFCGGASSIDKQHRVEGKSWWPQEHITYGQIQRILDNVSGPIDAVFSHEHPATIPYSEKRYGNSQFGISDRMLLDQLLAIYKPRLWFFGHHHAYDAGIVKNTEWHCCPIIECLKYLIWDGGLSPIYYG